MGHRSAGSSFSMNDLLFGSFDDELLRWKMAVTVCYLLSCSAAPTL